MTQSEFDSIVRDVATTIFPTVKRGVMNEFLFALNEELYDNGFEFEGGRDDNDVRDDDDEEEYE